MDEQIARFYELVWVLNDRSFKIDLYLGNRSGGSWVNLEETDCPAIETKFLIPSVGMNLVVQWMNIRIY